MLRSLLSVLKAALRILGWILSPFWFVITRITAVVRTIFIFSAIFWASWFMVALWLIFGRKGFLYLKLQTPERPHLRQRIRVATKFRTIFEKSEKKIYEENEKAQIWDQVLAELGPE